MKHKTSKILVIFTVVALLLAIGAFAFADTPGEAEIKNYSGTVSFKYGGGFFLKTDTGNEYKLVLGPYWYLKNLGLELKQGDRITVTGIVDDGILFAGKVKKSTRTYEIAELTNFDDFHCPMWGHGFGRWGGPARGYRGEYGAGMMRDGGYGMRAPRSLK